MNTSKTEMPPAVKNVFNEIKKFEAAQSKYRNFGACDTEPDGVFQHLIGNALKGLKPTIPSTGGDWELYASSMDCRKAAAALRKQAANVVDAVEACPIREFDLLRSKLQNYCWRLSGTLSFD